ncbi:MAG TPA: phosphatase PAP2 family protein [Roseiarcus sp.]
MGAAGEMAGVPEVSPGVLAGYLSKTTLPDSVALLPPPPAVGSPAAALDQEIARANLALRDTPRWYLARMDADLKFPWAAGDFSCALGVPITEQDTPRLYVMLRRILADAGAATGAAKDKYRHARPFMLDSQPTCRPEDESALRANGSYPSGHTSIGWAWALVLAEASPDQSGAVLARGRAFGESRLVCNVHWESDVIEGRFIGAATVSRLHAEPAFLADLEAAKSELAAARAKSLAPQRDCTFESQALAETPLQSP